MAKQLPQIHGAACRKPSVASALIIGRLNTGESPRVITIYSEDVPQRADKQRERQFGSYQLRTQARPLITA